MGNPDIKNSDNTLARLELLLRRKNAESKTIPQDVPEETREKIKALSGTKKTPSISKEMAEAITKGRHLIHNCNNLASPLLTNLSLVARELSKIKHLTQKSIELEKDLAVVEKRIRLISSIHYNVEFVTDLFDSPEAAEDFFQKQLLEIFNDLIALAKTVEVHEEAGPFSETINLACHAAMSGIGALKEYKELKVEQLDLGDFVEEILALTNSWRPEFVVLKTDIQKGHKVLLDRNKFSINVIGNLIKNVDDIGREHGLTPEDPVQVEIKVLGGSKYGFVELHVWNDRFGILQEFKERVFDEDFTQRKGGSGAGLSSAKQTVISHGGVIHAHGYQLDEEPFAEFRILLPIVK